MGLRRLAIVFLILAGCGTPPDLRYKNGRLLLKQGKRDAAMREAEAGLRAESSWRFRILKADVLIANFDNSAATELFTSALHSYGEPTDPESLVRLCMDQGWIEYLAANYAHAEALLERASQTAKTAGFRSLEAVVEYRLGLVEVQQGRVDAAERAFRHAIDVSAAQHDPYLGATAVVGMGNLFEHINHFEEAISWYDKARLMYRQLGSTDYYYIMVGNLGWCYARLGDSDLGLVNLEEAEAHARQIKDPFHEQLWLGDSGTVLYDRDDLRGAAEKFKLALKIAQSLDKNEKEWTGWWYYNLASVSIDLHKFDEAESDNKEALSRKQAIGNRADFYPRVNEAHIAAGRKDPRAEALYRGLIGEYREGMNPVPMLEAQAGLAGLLEERGEFDQADAQFRAALANLETSRTALLSPDNRLTYLAKLIRFYDRYINFLVDRGQPERALEAAESSRARVLDETLESKSKHAVVSSARMRDLARSSHSVFLSYWLGKKRSFLWAVTADGVTLHELPAESQIAPLVMGYRSFIENLRDPLQSEYPAGRRLSEILLGPVRPLISASQHIVLVPDRSLHLLNFETLPDPEDPSKYVLERLTLQLAPSLDLLADARPPAASAGSLLGSLLVIGDPEQAIQEYPRLPFAASEVEMVAKMFPAENRTVLARAEANPAAYRDARPAQFSWIHFAAHAAANQSSPLDSALILSPKNAAYKLSAREVMNVPLRANLVTLSACRSAGAKTYSGEGPVGLSWAFLRAGARSVVAGLWDVTDRSTASLMADFYDQLSHKVAPADALRHAKLSLLHGGRPYQKPFYWAPFQLYAGTI